MLPDARFLSSTLAEPLGLHLRFRVLTGEGARASLTCTDRARYEQIAGTARAQSWLLGRTALEDLRSELGESAGAEALTFPNQRFSLTHAGGVALAVAEPTGCLAGIGIDLEPSRRMRPEAARFFLTEAEQQWLRGERLGHQQLHLLRLWCVKEAVFKANPENAGRILADHALENPEEAVGEARTPDDARVRYASWCGSRACVALAVCP